MFSNALVCKDGLDGQIAELQLLIKRSKAIIASSENSDAGNNESLDKEIVLQESELEPDTIEKLTAPMFLLGPEDMASKEQVSAESGQQVLDRHSRDKKDDNSSDSDSGLGAALKCYVDCLMDLTPTLEKSLTHVELKQQKAGPVKLPFSVSQAELPFVLQVWDKFPAAAISLVERLGKSNWERYIALKDRTKRLRNIRGIEKRRYAPSHFHDSELGPHLASCSQKTTSIASHTSFISENTERGHTLPSVPRTPPKVASGTPFRCDVCLEILYDIRDRVDWK